MALPAHLANLDGWIAMIADQLVAEVEEGAVSSADHPAHQRKMEKRDERKFRNDARRTTGLR